MLAENARKSKRGYKTTEKPQLSNKDTKSLELYYLTKAYNRGEMQFSEWLEKSYKWALTILDSKADNEHN